MDSLSILNELTPSQLKAHKERLRYWQSKGLSFHEANQKAFQKLLVQVPLKLTPKAHDNRDKSKPSMDIGTQPLDKSLRPSAFCEQKSFRIPGSCQWQQIPKIILDSPYLTFNLIALAGTVCLLTYLQTQVYSMAGINSGLAISIVTESALLILPFNASSRFWQKFLKTILLITIFLYSIGLQTWGILEQNERKLQSAASSHSEKLQTEALLKSAILAKESAAKYGDHAGVRRENLNIQRYEVALTEIATKPDRQRNLLEAQAVGLIILRGILMLSVIYYSREIGASVVAIRLSN